ncbi:Na(+)/H(+) exchange regulatory cofactor NHE-RF1-like [Neolamprologus brichardi]|uniref:Na(+)/H(+) exchange regulatory cofactor NHE-RF1-like n=1 Tax=Neolamprologus brichardi TaxID=32507 RepID=UPI001643A481|nr:Na(+)/H(+) exchange regulatory cofactor NHE-RF1-like [Neolamprologus brichardi]
MSKLRPRLCVLEKGPSGYGFHLHGEKGKIGQFIRLVESDTPASEAGLLAGDRLMFVNGESVEGDSHQQVVAKIRATSGALELIVVDPETSELLKKHNLQCRKEFVTEGIPIPGSDSDSDRGDTQSNGTPAPLENGDSSSERSERHSVSSSTKEERDGRRPRLCLLKKATLLGQRYGSSMSDCFLLSSHLLHYFRHSNIRTFSQFLLFSLQVNGMSVAGMQHSEVVAAIKAGGDETRLLVVDIEAEEFFQKCNVMPTEEHISGPLPEPMAEDKINAKPKVSASSSVSSASSSSSLPAATDNSSPSEIERASRSEPAPAIDSLGLALTVAQAKERAQQKRGAKKAPAMDWSKRNELFSNL